MKYQILISIKNKKNITNMSSAEYAQRVVKVNGRAVIQLFPTQKHSLRYPTLYLFIKTLGLEQNQIAYEVPLRKIIKCS